MFTTGKPFQPSLMFGGKAKSLAQSGKLERCFNWVGSSLTHKHYAILYRAARDEHYNLLQICRLERNHCNRIGLVLYKHCLGNCCWLGRLLSDLDSDWHTHCKLLAATSRNSNREVLWRCHTIVICQRVDWSHIACSWDIKYLKCLMNLLSMAQK